MLVRVRNLLSSCPAAFIKNVKQKYSTPAVCATEQTDKVVYPPILDMSVDGIKKRKVEGWADEIKKLETVEEKLIKINMPRYYGWKSLHIQEGRIPYNSLHQTQYITRTHLSTDSKLPDFYDSVITSENLDSILFTVKNQIEDIIAFEYESRLRHHEVSEVDQLEKKKRESILANAIIYQINRTLLGNLSSQLPHIIQTQVDYEPRIEAFWFVGGLHPPNNVRQSRMGTAYTQSFADEPVDRAVRYIGSPVLQLRHDLPLKPIVSLVESENEELTVPKFKYDPKVLGYSYLWKHGTNIPGFWPGDPSEFGLLSYHNRSYFATRNERFNDEKDALAVQAIFACYSWLLSQSCYQGFSTYNDITYPLVTQMAITNGKRWSFCVYQLNTVLLHSTFVDENPRRNICWMTEPADLFESIENGKVHGLNEDVLKQLIRFYVNVPQERVDVDMKPYLGKSVKVIADIREDERREWLERCFKHIASNRPRHKRIPEKPLWEKVYEFNPFKFRLRPTEPWRLNINVMRRRLDDHLPKYIPKCLRKNPRMKKVGRWEKTYYP